MRRLGTPPFPSDREGQLRELVPAGSSEPVEGGVLVFSLAVTRQGKGLVANPVKGAMV